MSGECIICQIIQRQAKAHIVFEDETTICFLNPVQNNYGSTIVAPKCHVETFFDLDAAALHQTMQTILHTTSRYRKRMGPAELVVRSSNSKELQGYDNRKWRHFHWYLVPQYDEPLLNSLGSFPSEVAPDPEKTLLHLATDEPLPPDDRGGDDEPSVPREF